MNRDNLSVTGGLRERTTTGSEEYFVKARIHSFTQTKTKKKKIKKKTQKKKIKK